MSVVPTKVVPPVKKKHSWVADYKAKKYVQGGTTIVQNGKARWFATKTWHRTGSKRGTKCGAPIFSQKKRVDAFPIGAVPCKFCFEPVELPYPESKKGEK